MSFYDGDRDAIAVVASFVAAGFGAGEPVIVVASAEHRPLLDAALVELGLDPHVMRSRGSVTLDAAETLTQLMVAGMPDAEAFWATVGSLVDDVQGDAARVRICDEMVAVLWARGNIAAALALEGCWNELASQRSFRLLCAYPYAVLDQASLADVGRVCALHSEVRPPTSYHGSGPATGDPEVQHTSWAFLPVPKAVPAMRRFVSGTLRSWGEEDLVADAVTVSSEMATNAISHADSPFHASIERSAGVVRIAVEDAGPGTAEQRQAAHEDLSGRGITIVEALAERWGHGHLPGGKVVWVEFPSTA